MVGMGTVGTFRLGPENGSLQVKTYREGAAAKVGHDLVIDVARWEATVALADDPAGSSIQLTADPRSLQVLEPGRTRRHPMPRVARMLWGVAIGFASAMSVAGLLAWLG